MKLKIPDISDSIKGEINLENAIKALEYNKINQFPWGTVDPEPSVRFKIAHDNQAIYVLYDVRESETLARYSNHNDQVHKDSCVEFFISFEGDPNYYNLEFNCLGVCRAGWGADRNNRQLLKITAIDQIQTYTKIKRTSEELLPIINWQLFLRIPLNIFSFKKIETLKGQKATANFYKCGDDLSKPHYITWNSVHASVPDFHLKSFFGEVEFL